MDPVTMGIILTGSIKLANQLLEDMTTGKLTPDQVNERWQKTGWNEAVDMWRATPNPNAPGA